MACSLQGINSMNASRKREKEIASWERYYARKAARLTREAKEKTLVGKVVKETKRVVGKTVETVVEKINPSDDPWEDEDWMVM